MPHRGLFYRNALICYQIPFGDTLHYRAVLCACESAENTGRDSLRLCSEGKYCIDLMSVAHENQRRFPDWAHGWDGTAHVLTSTAYG